jgi:hypothetical protein
MKHQVREPGQVIFLFGDESVHRRGRVAQRRPSPLADLRGERGPAEVKITVPQQFPSVPDRPPGSVCNGGTEAINGIIELHRRIARGFRNPTNYRLRMILAAGKLTHPNLR